MCSLLTFLLTNMIHGNAEIYILKTDASQTSKLMVIIFIIKYATMIEMIKSLFLWHTSKKQENI